MPAPRERDAATLRAALADVAARGNALARREAEARAELTEAQAAHGRLYASGANADTIGRQALAITTLRVELDGLASGRALLATEADTLAERIATAEAREALEALDAARAGLVAAQAAWRDAMTALMDGPFAALHVAVRAAGERTRAAAADAIARNPGRESHIEVEYRRLWLAFPIALFDALDEYRSGGPRSNSPHYDASAA